MAPLLLLALATSAVAVAAVAASGSKPSSSPTTTKDWRKVRRMMGPITPYVKPYYPPNISRAKYPLVTFGKNGDNTPSPGNWAIDITGTPWGAVRFYRNPTGMFSGERGWTGGPGSYCDAYAQNTVYDPETRNWAPCDPNAPSNVSKEFFDMWVQETWHDEDSFSESLVSAAERYFVPMAISIGATLIGGPTGAVIAFAAQSIWNIANGMPITSALVDAYQQRLAGTLEKSAYADTFKKVVGTYKQTKADIEAIRDAALKAYSYTGLNHDTIDQAVSAGIGVARAKLLQDAAIQALLFRLDDNGRTWLNESLKRGVYLQDWVLGMFAEDGADFLRWAYQTAGAALDQGKDPIAAVRPVIPKAMLDALGKIVASTASTDGPIGSVATAGAPRRRIQLGVTRRKAA